MGWLHAGRPEARLQPAFAPFPPANFLPALGLLGRRLRGGRPLIAVADGGGWPPLALRRESGKFWRLQPHPHLRQDTYGIVQPPLFQLFPEPGSVAIAGIGQHHSIRQTPASHLIDDFQRQFPLLTKGNLLRNARLGSSLGVADPTLGQIQPPPQRRISLLAHMVNTHRHLAVVGLSQRSRILPLHPDRMRPLLGEPRIIYNPCRIWLQLRRHPPSQPLPHRIPIPRALPDELLHGLHIPLRESRR